LLFFFHVLWPAEGVGRVIFKLATLAPEGSVWMKTFNRMNSEIEAATEGKVKFKVYSGGVLGGDKDILRLMRVGQIHGGGVTGIGLGKINRDIWAVEAPFLFRNSKEVEYVLKVMDARLKEPFERKGYVIMGWTEMGFIYMMSKRPINSIDDLKGAKVWTPEEDPFGIVAFQKAGITPVPLQLSDILLALQTNLVDVIYATPLAALALQWFTKLKYVTNVPLTHAVGALVISKKAFERISKPQREIIKKIFDKYNAYFNEQSRKANKEAMEVMMGQGIALVDVAPGEMRRFEGIVQETIEEMKGKIISREIYKELLGHLEEFRRASK
jgi:TRAP-type C4-dicarboxylate transport system substrate-binding protein